MIEVYTDGATNGTSISGAGIYIKTNDHIYEYSLPLRKGTNHEAEFYAVIKALEICKDQFPDEILSFRSDSKIVVDTIEKEVTKNETFRPLLEDILLLSKDFPYFFIKWIPEKQNKHADQLAKQAIHMQD